MTESFFIAKRRNTFEIAYMAKTILIVEDDKDIRQSVADALDVLGFQGIQAANGQEALDILSKDEQPSLILLDLMMPVMNGWQFRIHQQADPRISDIPVVVFSADGSVQQKGDAMGAAGFLKKPIDLDALEKIAHRYCAV